MPGVTARRAEEPPDLGPERLIKGDDRQLIYALSDNDVPAPKRRKRKRHRIGRTAEGTELRIIEER
ncbi:MAG: hypothetical protein KGL39_29590 [Patescibacteria group bacterium]|nr:hypothetical protein [Patescibacteria group bacterium]